MRHEEILAGKWKHLTELRAMVLMAMRGWFDQGDFIEILPPILTGVTGSCEWFPNAIEVSMKDQANKRVSLFLRQTAQLHLEPMTVAHERVYTIGPSFRRETKVTTRHLWEFTLVEFEARDFDLNLLMDAIQSLFIACFKNLLDHETPLIRSDLAYFTDKDFARIKYGDAIKLLQANGVTIKYGEDLSSHDEQLIVQMCKGLPTFVTNYPGDLKPIEGGVIKFFSMARNKDGTTECCDLLLPGVGETVGGAVREGNPKIVRQQFKDSLMYEHMNSVIGVYPDDEFEWYFETIKNDKTHSTGCGIGFERLIQFITGAKSIKECIEFPRSPDHILP